MTALLLVVIYIAFIGLGVPDSLFGTAWPAMYREFNLTLSAASYVTILTSLGTVIASLFSARLINRFKTGLVTALSTVLTAVSLLGFSLSANFYWLCLFAVPLGLGAGAVDSALNNYVAIHYRATHMSFLHCFYGLGVSISPYLMSRTLGDAGNWRGGYHLAFVIQALIALVTIISLPLWRHIGQKHERRHQEISQHTKTLSFRQIAKLPGIPAVWLAFVASCAAEITCGTWGSTYLVNSRGMAISEAAGALTFYYVGMTVGRFLSGLLATRLSSWRLIRLGQLVFAIAIVLILQPWQTTVAVIGLFMVGLGNGPIYPNLVHLTPTNFGQDVSQSVMSSQMAAASLSIMIVPPIFGGLAQLLSPTIFPYFIALMFLLMVIAINRLQKTVAIENPIE